MSERFAAIGDSVVESVERPRDPAAVADCLQRAREAGSAVVAAGGGTKLHWGNPLDRPRVSVLDLTLVDAVDVQPDEGIATVGAGVRLADLAEAAEKSGMYTLLDPIYPGSTAGGTVAADPVGPEHSLDRRLRTDLLGLEVALPNGELTRSGGRVVKNVTGFDLVRLYCGSLGTLGVITEITLRLRSRPTLRCVLGRELPELEAALRSAGELVAAPIELAGAGLRACSGGGFELLWILDGTEAAVAEYASRAEGEERPLESWEELRAEIRVDASGSTARVRLGGRASDTGELCRSLVDVAGAGALRLALPQAGVVFADVPPDALRALWERVLRARWSLFIERVPRGADPPEDVFGPPPESLPLMRALKARFDPDRVLAPGRFVGRI